MVETKFSTTKLTKIAWEAVAEKIYEERDHIENVAHVNSIFEEERSCSHLLSKGVLALSRFSASF